MRRAYRLLSCILVLVIAAAGIVPAAADLDTAQDFIDEIIDFNLQKSSASSVREWIDGDLTENAGRGSEWYIIALSKYGSYDFSGYEAALIKYLSENEEGSASSRQKYALTLLAVGSSDSYINETLNNSIGEQGVMSLIFGMHLLNNGCVSEKYTQSELTEELLSFQLDDGGWAVAGTNGDVDVTAMAVQALAPQYSDNADVEKSIDTALDFLSARQLESGDYSSYGVNNPESTAQVLVALSSLGIDAETDGRFIKNGNTVFDGIALYQLPDGSFCHKDGGDSNAASTVQVFYSMVAYSCMKTNGGSLYVFNDKEITQSESTTRETTSETDLKTAAEFSHTVTESEIYTETTVIETESFTQYETVLPEKEENGEKKSDYKLWTALAVLVLAAVICLVLLTAKKRNPKNFMIVILIAAAGIAFILFTDFQSADSYYKSASLKENSIGTVTLTVRCDTIADKSAAHIPDDGVILDVTEFEIEDGDTVYDILTEAASEYKIHVETSGAGDSVYVEGINNIYEMDFGDLSGWMYFVNGSSASVSCGEYKLLADDEIEWLYTCDIGKDLENV